MIFSILPRSGGTAKATPDAEPEPAAEGATTDGAADAQQSTSSAGGGAFSVGRMSTLAAAVMRRRRAAAGGASNAATSPAFPRFGLLTCCVSPQSDIGRVRIDRSMIGQPMDFRHIGHMGANDLSSSYNEDALSSLLSSKGDDRFGVPVPKDFRSKDVPISVSN